jgi:hypothetical protein
MPRRSRRYLIDPDVPSIRTILNPQRGFFSVVIPLARTNLVTNPSIETNTTGYTAVGGSIAQSSADQYHGAYSLAVTPSASVNSDGAYYGTVSLTSGTSYAYSCKFKGAAGRKYTISIATTGGIDLSAYTFTATGRWQWVWGFWAENSSTTRRFYIRKNNHNSAAVFYVDGLQIEALDTILAPTTYIDGDQAGLLANQYPVPYRWSGTAHASTSTRDATTRAGGYVLNFDRLGFKVLACAGLGLAVLSNIALAGAAADGAQYQTTVVSPRQFALRGVFDATNSANLDRVRSDLYSAIGPDSAAPRQPLTLLYQAFDCERECGSMGRIIASYQSGLEQNASAIPREDATITFTQWLPTIYGGDTGAVVTVQQTVANANRILQRSAAGLWSAMGTGSTSGAPGEIHDLARGLDGKIYATGSFAAMGGAANTAGIAVWDPATSTWAAMGTGLSGGAGVCLIVGPDGSVYVGGSFTGAGGVANTLRIARWDGSAWNALSTGANGTVTSFAFDNAGNLYAGGSFTSIGGVATSFIAKWSGSAFSALTSIPNSGVNALARDLAGNIYAGGNFTTIGGSPYAAIAKYDGSAWSALGSGITGLGAAVRAIAVAPNGHVFVGGDFQSGGGLTSLYLVEWTGTAWRAFTEGSPASPVDELTFDQFGTLWVGGEFTTIPGAIGGSLPTYGLATWKNGVWLPVDLSTPAFAALYAILPLPDGGIVIGWDRPSAGGTYTAAALTTVTNNGTARAHPTIIIKNPTSSGVRAYDLTNTTTGRSIIFNNLTINPGETIIIRVAPTGASMQSSLRGDITSAILPGSAPDLTLQKGANTISCFIASSSATTVMQWAVAYQSASDLTE